MMKNDVKNKKKQQLLGRQKCCTVGWVWISHSYRGEVGEWLLGAALAQVFPI